jgi:hypothetical protein
MFRSSRHLLLEFCIMLYQLQLLHSFEWQCLHQRPFHRKKVASRGCVMYTSVSLYYPLRKTQILSQNNPCPRRNSEYVISEWTVSRCIKIDFPKIVICNLKWTCTFWMWIWGLIWKPFLTGRIFCIMNKNQLVVAVNKYFSFLESGETWFIIYSRENNVLNTWNHFVLQ